MERFDPVRFEWFDPDFRRRPPLPREKAETDHTEHKDKKHGKVQAPKEEQA